MYQYSLSAYMEVFTASLRKAIPDAAVSKRVTNVISTFTKIFYDYGCTGELKKAWRLGTLIVVKIKHMIVVKIRHTVRSED